MNYRAKALGILVSLNLYITSVIGYHQGEQSGTSISIPTYEDPVSSALYLIIPGLLTFFAVQQVAERKLGQSWKAEPARKYSTITGLILTGILLISPVFHSLSHIRIELYAFGLLALAAVALGANQWEEVSEKLPI